MKTQKLQQLFTTALILCTIILLSGCKTTYVPTEVTGNKLRMEILNIQHNYSITAKSINKGRTKIGIKIFLFDNATITERPIYEKRLRYQAEGEQDFQKIRYELVPNEFIKGKPVVRRELKKLGCLKNCTFTINEQQVETDDNGIYYPNFELLLNYFDTMKNQNIIYHIKHPKYGQYNIAIKKSKLLNSLEIKELKYNTPQDGLQFIVDAPKKIAAGKQFTLKIKAKNTALSLANTITAKTVSRHQWLNNKTFYYKTFNKGESQTFSRKIKIPKNTPEGIYFFSIGFRTPAGPMPKSRIDLVLQISK